MDNDSENENEGILRLRLIPYNDRLTRTRMNLGFTQNDMKLMTGINLSKIHEIETLKRIATDFEKGEIASVLSSSVEFLFPRELELSISVGVFDEREKRLSSPQVEALAMSYMDGRIERFEEVYGLEEAVDRVLAELTPRERRIVELRFGIGVKRSHTLEEVGTELNVSGSRIREIEARALRKLRHPSRSRELKHFLGLPAETKRRQS